MIRKPPTTPEQTSQVTPPPNTNPQKPDIRSAESGAKPQDTTRLVLRQLQAHAPFTLFGAATGIGIMVLMIVTAAPASLSRTLFWTLHPLHVLLSALVTTAMYAIHARGSLRTLFFVGYVGSVGIATLSDSLMPFAGEWLLNLPNRGVHIGFIEKWWLINPLAIAGIALGYCWPHTKTPHAGHVLLSTWASLFHMTMALGTSVGLGAILLSGVFLFLAVWVPCCTSDIVFPLLFVRHSSRPPFGAGDRSTSA